MKAKSILVVTLMVLGATFSAVANTTPDATSLAILYAKGSKVVKVVYKGTTEGKVKINIYDAAGSLVYSEVQLNIASFIRPLNFEGLQSGEYTIELTDAFGKKVEKVEYNAEKSVKYVHINQIKDSSKYVISVVGDEAQLVTVRIFNGDKLVFDQPKRVANEYAEVYNVGSLAGPITFEVVDNSGKIVSKSY